MKHPKSNIAAATYLVFFLPWIMGEKDEFVVYHQKQAIILAIAGLAGQGAIGVLGYWFASFWLFGAWSLLFLPLLWALRIFMIYEAVMGIKAALAGEKHELPWIGKFVRGI